MFNHTQQSTISNMLLATVFLLGCVALALPVSNSASSTKHDLNHLMSLLGKLKGAQKLRQDSLASSTFNLKHHRAPASAVLPSEFDSSDFDTEEDDDDTSSMSKRQGAWSFDYGLGGGRFGKRGGYGYPEYGLGGGRFGRDVDHVDPNHDTDVATGL